MYNFEVKVKAPNHALSWAVRLAFSADHRGSVPVARFYRIDEQTGKFENATNRGTRLELLEQKEEGAVPLPFPLDGTEETVEFLRAWMRSIPWEKHADTSGPDGSIDPGAFEKHADTSGPDGSIDPGAFHLEAPGDRRDWTRDPPILSLAPCAMWFPK